MQRLHAGKYPWIVYQTVKNNFLVVRILMKEFPRRVKDIFLSHMVANLLRGGL